MCDSNAELGNFVMHYFAVMRPNSPYHRFFEKPSSISKLKCWVTKDFDTILRKIGAKKKLTDFGRDFDDAGIKN